MTKQYGLLGRSLAHSFSKSYFTEKFKNEAIDANYRNYQLAVIDDFKNLIKEHELSGLNVTIPYKREVLPFLDDVSDAVKEIGACNVIEFRDKRMIGHNTDYIGFSTSLTTQLAPPKSALVLGTGGASKAIQYALDKMGTSYKVVSRKKTGITISYSELRAIPQLMDVELIVNTTPLGMYPNEQDYPQLPYDELKSTCVLYDLIYNPELTRFMKFGKDKGLRVFNGLDMLKIQAEESYKIWTAT